MTDDLISRQAAIDAINSYMQKPIPVGTTSFQDGVVDGYARSVSILKCLPSAESQRWVPVTERLPKENGDYLVTGRHGAVNKRKYEDGRWYGNWAVIAWMPLPEPWKGDEDDE